MGFWLALYYIATIALTAYTLMNQPKQQTPAPATLQDFDVPKAEEGAVIPVLFGTKIIRAPNVLWYGDLKTVPLKKKGGKK